MSHHELVLRSIGRRRMAGTLAAVSGGICLVAGCSMTAAPPAHLPSEAVGIVTGVAGACTPPMMPANYQKVPVSVLLLQHGRTVERQTVTGAHKFSFQVPPGTYILQSAGAPTLHLPVAVRSGGSTTLSLPSPCS